MNVNTILSHLKDFVIKKIIKMLLMRLYTPQQNDIVELRNLTLFEMVMSMIVQVNYQYHIREFPSDYSLHI